MRVVAIALLIATGACERDGGRGRLTGDGCPTGFTTTIDRHDPYLVRSCEGPNGESDWLEIDWVGNVMLYRHWLHDKQEGVGLSWSPDEHGEVEWHDGKRNGPMRWWKQQVLVDECYFTDGHPDGPCWHTMAYTEHRHGRRSGIWRIHWPKSFTPNFEVRIYGNGTLLAVDGHPVPLPPDTIAFGHYVIRRRECDDDMLTSPRGYACAELFESYQRCELKAPAERDGCRLLGQAGYDLMAGAFSGD